MKVLKKIFLSTFLLCVLIFLFSGNRAVFGQEASSTPTPTPDNSSAVLDLQKKITDLENTISQLQGQADTLSSQIAVMDNQIKLTEARIAANEQQILDLTLDIDTTNKKISSLAASLDNISQVLINRIKNTYEVGTIQPVQMLLSSNDATNFLTRLNYLKIAQEHDRKLIIETTAAKNDYSNQKNILESKKKQIEALKKQQEDYNTQLASQKQSKQDLLAQTQGNESTYQSLLSQARAQLAALSSFARSVTGGVSIIPHQDLSDSWGKYYNQRDSNWGNNLIGSSTEQIWDVGCLLTSYAMVVTHYGGSVSPANVASNNGNFFGNTAYFLKPGPSANGHSASDVSSPSLDSLRSALNSGQAVIAGLSYDGGPIADHWVVLRSVDGDSFRINDPLYGGAMNASLKDHYSGLKIVEARIYQ